MGESLTRTGRLVAGRFQLERELGRGAAATVWRARDLDDGRAVAVKLFEPEYLQIPQARGRIEREAQVLAALDHPNIARALDVGIEAEQPYVALELVEGNTLDDVLVDRAASKRTMSAAEISAIMRQLVRGIAHAHAHRVVHRDLKPSNVMLARGPSGLVLKVLDFGVAKLLDLDSHAVTTQGRFIGTLIYMSPEQLLAEEVDERADVFSAGAMLFELLTLRRAWVVDARGEPAPFEAPVVGGRPNTFTEVIDRILVGERPRPSDYAATTPALDDVVRKALARSRFDRYPSIRALGDALEPALEEWADSHADTEARPARGDTSALLEALPTLSTVTAPEVSIPTTEATDVETATDTSPIERVPTFEDEEERGPRAAALRVWDEHRPSTDLGRRRPLLGALTFLVLATAGMTLSIEWRARKAAELTEPTPQEAPVVTPSAQPRVEARATAEDEPTARAREARPRAPALREPAARETEATTEPQGAREGRPREVSSVEAPVRPRTSGTRELRELLRRAEQDPALVSELARRVDAAAAPVSDARARERIRRIAASSALVGDLDGITRALDLLDEALR